MLSAALCVLCSLAVAASASATDRYAAPAADGPWPCVQSDPCSARTALSNAGLQHGDRVLLAPGAYPVEVTSITISKSVTVMPIPGSVGRPILQSTNVTTLFAWTSDSTVPQRPVVLRDISIVSGGTSGYGVHTQAATDFDRVNIRSSGDLALLVRYRVNILNSLIWTTTANDHAVQIGGPSDIRVRNSTIIALGTGAAAIRGPGSSYGEDQHLDVVNSILMATGTSGYDMLLSPVAGPAVSTARVAYSSYRPAWTSSGVANWTINLGPGSVLADTAPPLLIPAPDGAWQQLPGSPTINAGTSDPAIFAGTLPGGIDLGKGTRAQGGRIDIGAYEHPVKLKIRVKVKKLPGGKKVRVQVRPDELATKVKFAVGVRGKTVKNVAANKWKTVKLKVKNPNAKRVKVKVTATDREGNKRVKTIRVKL